MFFSLMMYAAFMMQNPPSLTAIVEDILGLTHDEMFRSVPAQSLKAKSIALTPPSLSPIGKNSLELEKERRYYGYKADIARYFHRRLPGLWAAKTYRTHTSPFTGMALFYALFLFFSVLGIFYQGYFYVYHGFGIIIGNDSLDRAIKVSGVVCIQFCLIDT